MAAINRDPMTAPHRTRNDALLAAGWAVLATAMALLADDGRRPDALGWALLLVAHVPLVWRRHRPVPVLLAVMACIAPYHALDNNHAAPIFATMVVLYTVAATGTVRRTLLTGGAVLGVTLILNGITNPDGTAELLRISGWVFAFLFCGIDVRYYRQYFAAVVERAERAERTREEEARRRVAEERLRIARDLHDLLAHSITLIGVQTSVAAHVLAADPDRLDRATIAKALDDIAETCRTARGEVRGTLEVLREQGVAGETRGPLPGLDGLPDLVEAARLAGARVESDVRVREAPPAVGAAAYRIVQEALTNAVRHAGPEPAVRVALYEEMGALRLSVADDGRAAPCAQSPGYGLVGMRERARSVGGTLDAGPRDEGGFEVSAVLPTGIGPTTGTVSPTGSGLPEESRVSVGTGREGER
ncbi:two-component sensor histidine kinase [Streptomyces sp. WAC 05379]|uniref:sensor histidine kinase n=1 Tax=Streptomyces sp. WAC 05379 TaxID=2203207 RepID=UPI000F73F8A6|nr:histidine kinase [Streptomyces sp. WAC 05379]RSN85721.1 two-component sensor histidine kinase [Streptomyces sp. WAC 05379]